MPADESVEVIVPLPTAGKDENVSTLSTGDQSLPSKSTCSVEVQTDMTSEYIVALEAELIRRNSEIYSAREQIEEVARCVPEI